MAVSHTRRCAASVTLIVSALALSGGVASAAEPEPKSPAIVGPMLKILTFGARVGVPTGCQLGSSVLGSAASQYGAIQTVSPLIVAINNGCGTFTEQALLYIGKGEAADDPLAAVNPYVNPGITTLAAQLSATGTQYDSALAPFGPTIAGIGGTLAFFEGS